MTSTNEFGESTGWKGVGVESELEETESGVGSGGGGESGERQEKSKSGTNIKKAVLNPRGFFCRAGMSRIVPKPKSETGAAIKLIQLRLPMLILVSFLLLTVTALTLAAFRIAQPAARYTWLIAAGGGILALVSVLFWQTQMPFELFLPAWGDAAAAASPILFSADGRSWVLALGVAVLTVSTLLTAVTRPVFTVSLAWAGTLALGGVGVLAVTADNPLTLLLVWAALDLMELVLQLGSVNGPEKNEKVVVSFSARALGIGVLLWASILSAAAGAAFDFELMDASLGVYLIVAAGLRLGVFPLHLPYSAESRLRRGFGTSLRLVSAASSLALLGRVPAGNLESAFTPGLIALAMIPALYGGWMWLRAPDELSGRPYWVISIASLSVLSALGGNPTGAAAWGSALMLVGGALFLSSAQHVWLNRILLVGAFSLSSLPFSLTASVWIGSSGWSAPFIIVAQAFVVAGFIRHAMRSVRREPLEAHPGWARGVYSLGIVLFPIFQLAAGLLGWEGARQTGAWLQAVAASLLTVGLVWAAPRLRILNPGRADWLQSSSSRLDRLYQGLWSLYRAFARIGRIIAQTLEGQGGVMWTVLFLALFISILTQGAP